MADAFLWQLDAVSLGPARLRGVSLTIERGATAIIGWSGAGKTSLLNVLAGFERPGRGTVRGTPRVSWVPQNGGLWPHCTAREHIEIAGGSTRDVAGLLDEFDLAEKDAARPHELSEGERSRLAVARALACAAEVVVLDEPLAHVDSARTDKYWRAIRGRLAGAGASLVFATHVPELVLGEASRVACIREGRVLHEGSVAELYARPATPELMRFLGPGNWLTPAEAKPWLGIEIAQPRCFRPEEIAITADPGGRFHVSGSRFMGSVAEAQLCEPGSTPRSFFHRPADGRLEAGMRASIRALRP